MLPKCFGVHFRLFTVKTHKISEFFQTDKRRHYDGDYNDDAKIAATIARTRDADIIAAQQKAARGNAASAAAAAPLALEPVACSRRTAYRRLRRHENGKTFPQSACCRRAPRDRDRRLGYRRRNDQRRRRVWRRSPSSSAAAAKKRVGRAKRGAQ